MSQNLLEMYTAARSRLFQALENQATNEEIQSAYTELKSYVDDNGFGDRLTHRLLALAKSHLSESTIGGDRK